MPASLATPLLSCPIGSFRRDDGTVLDQAAFRYALQVPAGPSSGLIIVCPSLTGTPEILHEWWRAVGPAHAQRHYTTLYPHAFASGTSDTGTASMRDLARAIVALVAALHLPHPTFVTGGSLGGMLALEVGVEFGAPTHSLVLAAPAVQTAWGAGWNHIQLQALALAGDAAGFALARAVGMMTYRTEQEFELRFGSDTSPVDGRTMVSYLEHHGQKLAERFDVGEYTARVRAMDTHDVGRGRGGWRDALRPHAERISAVGVIGDALYSAEVVEAWTTAVGAAFHSVTSIHGHDAFLLEQEQIRAIVDTAFSHATLAPAGTGARHELLAGHDVIGSS